MNPLVSIVIPAFNNEDHIRETLRSVTAQTYENVEIIIADHSSTDGTAAAIDEFSADPRVRVLSPTPRGGGAPANWNRVTQEARGEYVKLVCGDDLLRPDCVAAQVEAAVAYPGCVMVAARRDIVDDAGEVVLGSRGLAGMRGVISAGVAVRETVRSGTNPFGEPACVLVRRHALLERGWDDTHSYMLDVASYMHVLDHGDVFCMEASLASFRVSAGQWSVRLMRSQATEAKRLYSELAASRPTDVSRGDVLRGSVLAHLNALARRAFYMKLKVRSPRAESAQGGTA
ncbi:glycosyltransferase involved in cell wall biosynthesis [Arthrobacter sp. PL16]|jgi:glycosyltransferase involved in cell wall biosynthesis|uniref:Glycosyltransferase family 2 protein n=1 Tax=Arthrobacter cheniae TaxID=1258888 RepID=A0A3A5M3Y6_9MICC|nr:MULTISPECIES: glycosyltransferase family A protein [Arthrobacter]MEC5198036.1 glycosyltransferase involved in cell wall biosynthesis [Arthrobacter sp. PL16]RJT78264.1 glycosyltransferase family 2 protein [Arthrobacter cheniae]